MAATNSGGPGGRSNLSTPVMALALGGACTAILTCSAALLISRNTGEDDPPPPAVVAAPGSVLVSPPSGKVTRGSSAAPKVEVPHVEAQKIEAWWTALAGSTIPGTVVRLKQALPRDDHALLDEIGEDKEFLRRDGYKKLLARLPKLITEKKIAGEFGALLADCYATDPAEGNVQLLREWFVMQLPKEGEPYAAGYNSEDLDRSFWVLDLVLKLPEHKAMLRPERVVFLSEDVGKEFGIDSAKPWGEHGRMRKAGWRFAATATCCRLEKNPSTRRWRFGKCWSRKPRRNSVPVARDKINMELAILAFPPVKKNWARYLSVVQACLRSTDPQIQTQIISLYAKADPEFAAQMQPVLRTKYQEFGDTELSQAEKVKAVRKKLGVLKRDDDWRALAIWQPQP